MSEDDKSSSSNASSPRGPFAFISKSIKVGRNQLVEKNGKKRSKFRRFVILPLVIFGLIGLLSFFGGSVYFWVKAMSFDLDTLKEVPQRTLVYGRDNKVIGHVSGHGENRLVVPVSEISQNFIKALLAREDSRFYEHGGVDYRGVARAVVANFKKGGMEQGASTLTMQLARNASGLRDMTVWRKWHEVAIARRIERNYTKDEILGFYVNRIYFGSGLYGIERASQGFFEKPASGLSPGEGAMLAGIIRGPSILNPFRNLEDAKATRDEVLARMVDEEIINQEASNAAKAESISLRPPNKRLATGSYVLQTVHDLISDFLSEVDIEQGGLRIYTSIDPSLQSRAEKALDSHLTGIEKRSGYSHPKRSAHQGVGATTTKYVQGAVVAIENATGAILTLVGGRDFGESPYNRALEAKRQTGSTFKPFVYAVAFDRSGLLPGDYVSDNEIRMDGGNGKIWSPKNSDGTFTGLQPAAIGLIRSRNTMSIRVGQIAGMNNVSSLARALKFGEIPNSPVSYLGAFETTPMTITSAFSTFPAKGVNRAPFLIERIENSDGVVLFQNEIRSTNIFPESVCWVTGDIMGKVMDEGTGGGARRAGYKAPAYGKTGTTNDYKDAWFVGYSDKITTGVWVGLDQPKTVINKGYGSTLALPVWTEVMKEAEKVGFASVKIPKPANTNTMLICRECGNVANRKTTHPYQMEVPADLAPKRACIGHGLGIFSSRRPRDPTAFPIPTDQGSINQAPSQAPRQEGGILEGIGRWLFGSGRR